MVDLLAQAKLAGLRETQSVREGLAEAFAAWLNRQDLREITDEELEVLHSAFERGFVNYYLA